MDSVRKGDEFPILKVVQRYLKTVRKGSGHWAVCPFHQDTSPSLSISESKNIFKCFACNASGNSVKFVMQIEKCGFIEAIKKIGEILSIDVSGHLNQKQNKQYELYKFNEHVAKHYHKYLLSQSEESKIALNYLTISRKLTLETIKKYRIGFAPKDNTLKTIVKIFSEEHSLSPQTLEESNLFTVSEYGSRFPFFRDRIMFPVMDIEGRITGFSGRGSDPKYLNLRNNQIFSKSQSLFNCQNLVENYPIHLFEGFIDLMKAEQELECINGIASMGGILDKSSYPTIRKYSNTIILCLDNDKAGRDFTEKTGKNLIKEGFEVMVVNFLDRKEKDIDEMIDKDAKSIKEKMKDAVSFLDWLYMYHAPSNMDEIKWLIDDCLKLIFDKHTLRQGITLEYSNFLIDTMFTWFGKKQKISNETQETIQMVKDMWKERAQKEFIQRSLFETYEFEEDYEGNFSDLNNLEQLLIRYSGLIEFMWKKGDELEEYDEMDWRYEINGSFVNEKSSWFIDLLESKKKYDERFEKFEEYCQMIVPIKNVNEFFNRYYNFYKEYLILCGDEAFYQYFKSLSERISEKWKALWEVKKLKNKSSEFFTQFKKRFRKNNEN